MCIHLPGPSPPAGGFRLRGCADRRSAIAPEVIPVRLLLEESLVIAVACKLA